MHLIVEDLHPDATDIGLTREAILAAAESRLRSARIYTSYTSKWTHYLYVQVSVVGGAFGIDMYFNKSVFDLASGENFFASTWSIGKAGTHGRSSSYILSSLSELLDTFLVEYLRVNEEACEKR